MSEYLIQSGTLGAIADAIRAKKGTANAMTPAQMAAEIAGITTVEAVSWHQCPEAVRNYLAYVAEHPYSTSDWAASYIADYAPSTPNEAANTKPIGYTVDGVTYRDNVPFVATSFATENKAGTLTALDHLRWFNTYTHNVRDLGGWACDGGTVRYGQLVRGGLPLAAYAAQDKALMVDRVGIRSELQLYGGSDDQYHYDEVSLWDIDWYGTDGFIWYTLGRRDLWQYNLGVIFDSVLHSKPVYFHCGAGKDRTGTIAVMLLALLGVSQSDIDQDFELTTFATGSGNGITSRTGTDYKNFINSIHAYPLANGLSDTLQNHAFSFVISLGFGVDTVNNFRAACIAGTPSIITPTAPSYTITNALTNCVTNNNQSSLAEGSSYAAAITANSGYTLSGATVSITMGGENITSAVYSNGTITIPEVTGNVVITISAVEEAATYTNLFDPSADGYIEHGRCSSTGADRTDVQTCFVTNYIPVTNGDVVRIKGASVSADYYSGVYKLNKTGTGVHLGTGAEFANYAVADGVTSFTVNYTDAAYVRMTCENADLSGVIVTVNEPI